MTPSPRVHPLAERFRRQLRTAARELPARPRRPLLEAIDAHLEEAAGPDATELEVRTALERLGSPEAIVAAAQPEGTRLRGAPVLEVAALLLLSLGSLVVPVLGWLVGAVLVLLSTRWTRVDKLLGILVWPGGFGALWLFGLAAPGVHSAFSCSQLAGQPLRCGSSGPPLALVVLLSVVLLGAPLLVLVRLAGRLRGG
ncbi:MAG TPA: hypothetical protein VNN74_04055 [Candidatus Micrarchaeia archaeon]|nr:hypothetical protein [Candidatus Micrarchaeia archaeon]